MTYDEYTAKVRARMKKLVRAENFIKKYRFLIIAAADILFIAFIFTMYFAGSFIRDLSVRDVTYGENAITEASAFLSGIKYTYVENGVEETGFPYGAGTYRLTAETINPFGVVRRQSSAFTVYKRKAFIRLSNFSTEYGSEPDFKDIVYSNDLAVGDVITGAEIQYDRFGKNSQAEITGVTILNRYGKDVTSSYELVFGTAAATVTPRKITVDTGSAEKKYDGAALTCKEYEITQGSLAYDDVIRADFPASLTLPGTLSNKAEIKIYDGSGADVSEKYTVTERIGGLTVLPLEFRIKTGSAEKEYDGHPLECKKFEIISSELLPGHKYHVLEYSAITEPGSIYNEVLLTIIDEKGQSKDELYSVIEDKGVLTVKPRELTFRSGSASYEYDGTPHGATEKIRLVDGKLYPGDRFYTGGNQMQIFAKTYKNTFNVWFKGVVPESAYHITYEYGTLTIRKRPLTLYVKIYVDKNKNKIAADIDGNVVKSDRIVTPINIPADVANEDFEDYINSYLMIVNNDSYETNAAYSYEKTYVISYDETELDEFRIAAGVKVNGHGTGTGTGTGTGNAGSGDGPGTYDAEQAEQIYGPSGIGSGGISGGIDNSPSPYSDIPDSTPDLDGTSVGSVSSLKAGAVYLRLRSFGDYTGSGWSEPALYGKKEKTEPLDMTYASLIGSGYNITNEIEVKYNADDGLAPVPYFSQAASHKSPYKLTDVAVPKENGDGKTFYYSQIPMVSISTLLSLKDSGAVSEEYRSFVYDNYLSLPEETEISINGIISSVGLDRSSPTVIQDVANYVKNAASYNGSFEKIPEGQDRVLYFLTKSREGICGHFASAATVIYRALGIPARYTVGYYVVTEGQNKPAEFYEKDAHAWVEVFVDSVGWIPVEVTASSVSPSGASSALQPPDTDSGMFYNIIHYQMSSVKKNYDGEELYSDTVKLLPGSNLREGDVIKARTKSIKYTGAFSLTSTEFAIYDEHGNDVTLLYDVFESGYAEVEIKPRIVYMPDINLYVGQTVTLPSYEDAIDKETAELIGYDHKITFDFTRDGSIITEDDTVTGVSVENDRILSNGVDLGTDDELNYYFDGAENGAEIVFRQRINVLPFENVRIKSEGAPEKQSGGVIRVTGENGLIYNYLAVRSADAFKKFDGGYLSAPDYEILSGALAYGHTLEYESGTYLLYAGSEKNLFRLLRVKDEKGVDVTGEYIIDFYPGELTVVTGEYGIRSSDVEIEVDGKATLDGIILTDSVSNARVSYDITGDKPNVRVEDGMLIGIEPGISHIKAAISEADINGDGINEYDTTYLTLTVSVTPKARSENTGLYIALVLCVAAAGAAVTFAALKLAAYKKDRVKKDKDE